MGEFEEDEVESEDEGDAAEDGEDGLLSLVFFLT